jgi:hypothetical protein
MRIKTLKDWKRFKLKQHPLFYIFILFIILDWSIFAKLDKTQEGEIGDSYNGYYYVDEDEAASNRVFLREINNIVIPLVIISQLILIFWISLRIKRFISNKYFPYTNDLIWLLWTTLGIGGYFCIFYLIPKKEPWFDILILFAFFPYLGGQWFLFKFWRKYLWAFYYVHCPKCKKEISIDSWWFDYSKEKYTIREGKCHSCKEDLNLHFHTEVHSNNEYLFNWNEKQFGDNRYY